MSTGIQMGNIRGVYFMRTPSITPASTAASTSVEQTFTVPGLAVSDLVFDITAPSDQADIYPAKARVSAANTLAIKFTNATVGAITPVAGVYTFITAKPDGPALLVSAD